MSNDQPSYLIRLDDFCPTMLRNRREQILDILQRYGVSPIVAIVPDNQDPDLMRAASDPGFWDRMRSLQSAGATIAMHGFRHTCTGRGPSLLRLHDETEFAGVDSSLQQEWIRTGLTLLRDQKLEPRLFVAPRHGFDRNTLSALVAEGLNVISDGFARRPFTEYRVLWIPQQLWEPVQKTRGLWTICIHTNTATASLEEGLSRFLERHSRQFTRFEDVVAGGTSGCLNWNERFQAYLAETRTRMSAARSKNASRQVRPS